MPDDLVVQIGDVGSLTCDAAFTAANFVIKASRLYQDSIIHIYLTGFDDDPREIWEIPEAKDYVRSFWRALKAEGADPSGINFADHSLALLGVCLSN